MNFNIKLSIALAILVLTGCKSEPVSNRNMADEIKGKWLVTESTRNRKPTTTLKDAFFTFTGDSMRTNVLGTDNTYKFEVTGSVLTQTGEYMELVGDKMLEYKIQKLTPDSLVLSTKIRNYNFMFVALKDLENAIQ